MARKNEPVTQSMMEAQRTIAWGSFLKAVGFLFKATGWTWRDLAIEVTSLACAQEVGLRQAAAQATAQQEQEEGPAPLVSDTIH